MSEPVGVVLAGGRGRRLGGRKPLAELAGRPLISYPLAALRAVLSEVRVVAKPSTPLPELAAGTLWLEPEEPQHPLTGLLAALRHAAPLAIVVCAADMPLLSPELIARLAHEPAGGRPARVAVREGRLEPLLGRYEPVALGLLERAALGPLRDAVQAIDPEPLPLRPPESEQAFNVNTPQDLAEAERRLALTRR